MSNLLNQNSRFAALVDNSNNLKDKNNINKVDKQNITKREKNEQPEKEIKNNVFKGTNFEDKDVGFNSFKNNNKERHQSNKLSYYSEREKQRQERYIEEENNKKVKEQLEKDRLKQESLKEENFPSLGSNVKVNENKDLQLSYMEKIKQTNIRVKNNIDPDLVNLKPGWVLLKRDSKTGQTIMKTLPGESHLLKFNEEPKRSEKQIGKDILKALVDLHEKRTKEYIETYGEYTWEKMFKRPNWREEESRYLSDTDDDDDDDYGYTDNTDDDTYDDYGYNY